MPDRIVVCFRTQLASARGADGLAYLERARTMKKRAEALGGTMCAWSAQTFAFDFAIEDLEEAIDLAAAARDELPSVEDGGAPVLPWSAGASQGEMIAVQESGSLAIHGWGPPLVVAVSLARIARPGEVLMDPQMPCVQKREILTAGVRVAKDGERRVRGLVLDPRQTWRRDAAQSVTKLLRPTVVDREAQIAELLADAGMIGVVRADAGLGGTRLLEELARSVEPARALVLSPAGAEPLSAVRRALARFLVGRRVPALPAGLDAVLERIQSGAGSDLGSVGALLAAWVAPAPDVPPGALLIDDAMEVDAASLDAVAAAAASDAPPFHMIVRLDAGSPFPAQLAAIPPGPEVTLGQLGHAEAAQLAAACTNHRLAGEGARLWARRGRYTPLGITEALAEALTTGELSWTGEAAVPRTRAAGRGRPLGAADWIRRRLSFVSPGARSVLSAVAILGGDAPLSTIAPLVGAASDEPVAVEAEAEALVETAWLTRPEPGWVALPTRTHRDVITGELDAAAVAGWHRAASVVLEHGVGKLVAAEAAAHAELAGDHPRAARLALVAEKAAKQAQLDWAAGPEIVRRPRPPSALPPPGRLSPSAYPIVPPPPPPISIPRPPAVSEIVSREPTTGVISIDVSAPAALGPRDTIRDLGPFVDAAAAPPLDLDLEEAPPSVPLVLREEPPSAPLVEELEEAPPSAPLVEELEEEPPSAPVVEELEEEAASAPLVEELEALDPGALVAPQPLEADEVVGDEVDAVEVPRDAATERRLGVEALSKGATVEALRALRSAVERSRSGSARERCRAALAYGVALAAAGRPTEALVEVLDALARAREGDDARGEQACAHFLAKLSAGAGHADVALTWQRVARS